MSSPILSELTETTTKGCKHMQLEKTFNPCLNPTSPIDVLSPTISDFSLRYSWSLCQKKKELGCHG